MPTIRTVHTALLLTLVAGTLLMFVLAGGAVFAGTGFDVHVVIGRLLSGLTLPLVVLAAVLRDRTLLIGSVALFVVFVLQSATIHAGEVSPWVSAVHPLTGAIALVGGVHLLTTSRRQAA